MPPAHPHGAGRWSPLRFCAAIGLVGPSISGLPIPSAQAQMDWGGIIGTYGQEDAVKDAARKGRAQRDEAPPAQVRAGNNPRTRAHCANFRTWAAEGMQDTRLPALLNLCRKLGY